MGWFGTTVGLAIGLAMAGAPAVRAAEAADAAGAAGAASKQAADVVPADVDAGIDADADITVEEVLANPLDDSAYANTTRCLATTRYRRIDIVGDAALLFYGRGDDAWLNVLPFRCPGLRSDMVLSIEQSNFRVCAMNRFRGLPRGTVQVGTGVCSLGAFERLSHEQARSRRFALLAEQRSRVVKKTIRAAQSGEAQDQVLEWR